LFEQVSKYLSIPLSFNSLFTKLLHLLIIPVMSFVSEFREFISKGNVLDLAVGVIIGAAFSKIVTSLTDDIIMPVVGLFLGHTDFSTIMAGPMKLGLFLNAVINFVIIAVIIFMIVKGANTVKKKPVEVTPVPAPPTADQQLLMEIRDSLRAPRG
jgi:large conductance mechanosensitive channel